MRWPRSTPGRSCYLLPGVRYEHTSADFIGRDVLFSPSGAWLGTDAARRRRPTTACRCRRSTCGTRVTPNTQPARRGHAVAGAAELLRHRAVPRAGRSDAATITLGNADLQPTTVVERRCARRALLQVGRRRVGGRVLQEAAGLHLHLHDRSAAIGGTIYHVTQPLNGDAATRPRRSRWRCRTSCRSCRRRSTASASTPTTPSPIRRATFPNHAGDSTLPGQSRHVGNLAASYEKRGFSRPRVDELPRLVRRLRSAPTNLLDRFYDTHKQLDISFSQQLTRNLRAYVERAQPERRAAALLPGRDRSPAAGRALPLVDGLRREGRILMIARRSLRCARSRCASRWRSRARGAIGCRAAAAPARRPAPAATAATPCCRTSRRCARPTRCRTIPTIRRSGSIATDPSKSLVLGTMKVAAPDGGLAVFGLDGKLRAAAEGRRSAQQRRRRVRPRSRRDADRHRRADRAARPPAARLRDRRATAAAARHVVRNDADPRRRCRRSKARRWASACTSARRTARSSRSSRRRPGHKENYLWQYRLEDDGTGRVKATFVRRFGTFSGVGEIEAIAVDDELGYVYYADEGTGIHKWLADPDAPDAPTRAGALRAPPAISRIAKGSGSTRCPAARGYIVVGRSAAGRERVPRLSARGRARPAARSLARCWRRSPAAPTAPTASTSRRRRSAPTFRTACWSR